MPDQTPMLIMEAVVVGVVALLVLTQLTRRVRLGLAILALSIVGPLVGLATTLWGLQAMTLTGAQVRDSVVLFGVASVVAAIVAYGVARPLARDMTSVSRALGALPLDDEAAADTARALPPLPLQRRDEVGQLARTIVEVDRTLRDQSVRRFAAEAERRQVIESLSHDLRTPLASIQSSLEAIEDGMGSVDTHLPSMQHSVGALAKLIEDLFLLARAEHAVELRLEPVDLRELLDEAVEAVSGSAARRQVGIRVEGPASSVVSPTLQADPVALGRVFRNLLDNAIRHSPEGGTVVVLHRRDGARWVIEVCDEGPGFEDDFLPVALERFTQADAARTGGGSGLGLAIARALMEAHGGTIEIQPGPGGRVRLVLPGQEMAKPA